MSQLDISPDQQEYGLRLKALYDVTQTCKKYPLLYQKLEYLLTIPLETALDDDPHLSHHPLGNKVPPQNEELKVFTPSGIVYLVQTKTMKSDCAKIGMSRGNSRLQSYGADRIEHRNIKVYKPQQCENALISAFQKQFGNPVQGKEYFKGDIAIMIKTFDEVLEKYNKKYPTSKIASDGNAKVLVGVNQQTDELTPSECHKTYIISDDGKQMHVYVNLAINTGADSTINQTQNNTKVSRKDNATAWINANPPTKKLTPTQYHEKYIKDNANKKTLDFKAFSALMKKLNYDVVRCGNSRYWKLIPEDSDSDDSDSDNE